MERSLVYTGNEDRAWRIYYGLTKTYQKAYEGIRPVLVSRQFLWRKWWEVWVEWDTVEV